MLDGAAGADILIGGAGADSVIGGNGIDTASYATSAAAVTLNLATPASNTGDAAGDTFSGIENVTGGSGADNITGDANANVLSGGGAGNDTLNASANVLDGRFAMTMSNQCRDAIKAVIMLLALERHPSGNHSLGKFRLSSSVSSAKTSAASQRSACGYQAAQQPADASEVIPAILLESMWK